MNSSHRDEEDRATAEWEFSVAATIQPSWCNATETIGSIAFDAEDRFMATAGIARKIKLYDVSSIPAPDSGADLEDEEQDDAPPSRSRSRQQQQHMRDSCVICTPARLSSVQFRRRRSGIVGCGDYDGVVSEWDIERGCAVVEREEHEGRHVWSIHYSLLDDDLCISASDDGSCRIWPADAERSAYSITSPSRAAICCAEFSPSCSNRIGMACADGAVYVHDLRHLRRPLLQLRHHDRAVSYVRFLSHSEIASMSIDSSIAIWRIESAAAAAAAVDAAAAEDQARVIDRFCTHHNVKNFVGLSALDRHGLVACGSETNQAFIYERGVHNPLLEHELPQSAFSQQRRRAASADHSSALVSAVCWRNPAAFSPSSCTLAAANSDGVLQFITGRRCSSS